MNTTNKALGKAQMALALGVTLLTLLPTLGARAQGGDTAAPLTEADRQFLISDAQGSVSDYANGEAAVSQAQNPAVRQLGIWLMEDHNRLNIALLTLAQRKGVVVPLTIADNDKSKLSELTALKGPDFDKQFLQQAIQTNQQDISDAKKELAATTDPEMRPLVTVYLATEYAHLAAAQSIQAMAGKTPAP